MIHNRLMGQTTIGNKGCRGMSEFRYFYKNLLEKDICIAVCEHYGTHYDDFRTKSMVNSNKIDR